MVVAALALAYLIGSIPTAYLVGRLKGIDVRKVGSGNMGATNIYRTLGAWPAAVVLLVDGAKGAIAALLMPRLFALDPMTWGLLFGLVAMVGHARPVFLGFKSGGKGVATAGGIFAALAPVAFFAGLAGFIITVAVTRYVSLGSMLAAAILPIISAITHGVRSATFAAGLAVTIFVFWNHRSNIGRLRRGEERRLGRPGSPGEVRGAR
ncbi:MAG: glycerol-3-phosphate 1-O-acyltransferase PlsY [Gemmatimonadaceae bacterium]